MLQLTSSVIVWVCETNLMKVKHTDHQIHKTTPWDQYTFRQPCAVATNAHTQTHIMQMHTYEPALSHTHTHLVYWLSSLLAIFSTGCMGRLKAYSCPHQTTAIYLQVNEPQLRLLFIFSTELSRTVVRITHNYTEYALMYRMVTKNGQSSLKKQRMEEKENSYKLLCVSSFNLWYRP